MARKNIQEKRRLQILEALHRRLLIKPFDKTSIKEIAAEANLNHGMLHYFFKSKEDILMHYIDYVINIYKTLLSDWIEENIHEFSSSDDFVKESFLFVMQKMAADADLFKIFTEIWAIGNYNEKVWEKLKGFYQEWFLTAEHVLSESIENKEELAALSMATVAFCLGLLLLSKMFAWDESKMKSFVNTLEGRNFFKALIS